jgi:anti-sigma factor RsiW
MKHSVSCTDIEQLLIEFAEGNLPAETIDAINLHLKSCPACDELVAEARVIFSSEVDMPTENAPESLWRSIQNKINRTDKGRLKQPTLLSTRRPFVVISLQGLAAAAALLLGIYLGSGSIQTEAAAQQSYEDQLVDYYASAFQGESAIPVGDVVYELEQSGGSGR